MLHFVCPSCRKNLRAADELFGRIFFCPRCRMPLHIATVKDESQVMRLTPVPAKDITRQPVRRRVLARFLRRLWADIADFAGV
jgi:hypothetical protein